MAKYPKEHPLKSSELPKKFFLEEKEIKMADSDIVVKNLTKKRLKRLLEMFCIYRREYHVDKYVCHWERCSACILHDIRWDLPNCESAVGKVKNLCYAIWHEDILNA